MSYYLVARDTAEMTRMLRDVLNDPARAESLVESGLETIRARHTCAHRVDELMMILGELDEKLRASSFELGDSQASTLEARPSKLETSETAR